MEEVGVAAVVKGLNSFLGDMKSMDNSISGLIPGTGLLQRAFSGLGDIMSGIGGFIANTLAHAFGELLADAIQWVTTQIKELITATIDAGKEFQTLELRLNTMNFNDLTEEEKEFANAQELATSATKEQLTWLQKIAAQTPYDNTDISNLYTLARGYGFVDDEARGLTETIIDFTSGMGLGNAEMTRIIKNFGQMQSLGKVMQRDLNDLATGAFVPVNKILAQMRLETGLAGSEFDNFRNSAEGVNLFLSTFTKMVESDFGGAAQKMARTFGAATDNVKDFIKSIFGLNIVKPILDVLGGRIAAFMDELTSESRWNTIVGLADRIGGTFSGIIEEIIGLGPSAEGMADKIVAGLQGVADWLDAHRDDIIKWVQDSAAWIKDELIPRIIELKDWLFGTDEKQGAIQKFGFWLRDVLIPMIQRASEWVANVLVPHITNDLIPVLAELVPLGKAIADALLAALGKKPSEGLSEWIHGTLIPAIQNLTKWITENEDKIVTWIGIIARVIVVLEIASGIINTLVGIVSTVVSILTVMILSWQGVLAVVTPIITAFQWLGAVLMTSTTVAVGVFVAAIVGLLLQFKFLEFGLRSLAGAVKIILAEIVSHFTLLKNNIINTIQTAVAAIRNGDWIGAGSAIIQGMYRGIIINAHLIINTLVQLAKNAIAAAKATLGIRSPSTVFFGIGEQLMSGFAEGITASAKLAVQAMRGASGAIAIPAMQTAQMAMRNMPTSSVTNQNTNNYNLSIHSNAPVEPILQDFNLLESLT